MGTSLHGSRSAEAEPRGCRFTRNGGSGSWLQVSEQAHISPRVLSARVGANISSDFMAGKAQGAEQKTKNNEGRRLSLLKEERATGGV